jgi:hypothetical protein
LKHTHTHTHTHDSTRVQYIYSSVSVNERTPRSSILQSEPISIISRRTDKRRLDRHTHTNKDSSKLYADDRVDAIDHDATVSIESK